MARPKSETLSEIRSAMEAACYRIVRSDNGRLYFTRPTRSGRSISAVEFNQETTATHVFKMLSVRQIEASMRDINTVLICQASDAHDDEPVPIYNRVAESEGVLYVDLCDKERRVIEIRPGYWRVCDCCQLLFHRPATALPLPDPVGGQSPELLRSVLGIDDDDVGRLALGFVLSCIKQRGCSFFGVIEGPTGAGKSTLARYLSRVLDPRNPQLPRIPTNRKDLMAVGFNRHILAFDNMAPLTPAQCADLCSMATGSGLESRELYSDSGVSNMDVQRPVLLNGIRGLLKHAEALSRAVSIVLPKRQAQTRRTDDDIEDDFRRHWPAILGSILDLAAKGLEHTGQVCAPTRNQRMMSPVNWVERCYQQYGLGSGLFLNAYERAQATAADEQCGSWSLLPHLRGLAEQGLGGLAKDLWERLTSSLPGTVRPSDWPSSPDAFGTQLSANEDALRQAGIEFTKLKTNKGVRYQFCLVATATPTTPVDSDPAQPERAEGEQRLDCAAISAEENDQLSEQFRDRFEVACKEHKTALLYFDLPNRPILCGPALKQASELLGRKPDDKLLLPVTPEELRRCRTEMGGVEVIPLTP